MSKGSDYFQCYYILQASTLLVAVWVVDWLASLTPIVLCLGKVETRYNRDGGTRAKVLL